MNAPKPTEGVHIVALRADLEDVQNECISLRAENARLRAAIEAVCTSSRRQLEGHGKGIQPSPNLEAAYEQARAALKVSP